MTEPKKRGRKPRPEGEIKRHYLTCRFRNRVLDRLKAEAEAEGLSMSEVIEKRLEASYDQPALIDALADRLAMRIADQTEQAHLVRVLDSLEPTTGYFL